MNPILEKIRKCLAMAEHERSNPTEAATALRMAQALMRQHGITQTDIEAAAIEEKQVLAARRTRTPWEGAVAAMVRRAFGLKCYWSHSSDFMDEWGSWHYYGNPARVEIATYAHHVLIRLIDKARKEYMVGKGRGTSLGDAFVLGFLEEVEAKLQPLVPTEGEERALSLYSQKLGLVRYRGKGLGDAADAGAVSAGRAAGQGVSIHQGMNQGPARRALR